MSDREISWEKVQRELEKDFTEEDFEEIEMEMEIIESIIKVRKNANLTQKELSERSGIIQPSIAKIETFARVPKYTTLMRLLRPMGYTIKIVPIDKKVKK